MHTACLVDNGARMMPNNCLCHASIQVVVLRIQLLHMEQGEMCTALAAAQPIAWCGLSVLVLPVGTINKVVCQHSTTNYCDKQLTKACMLVPIWLIPDTMIPHPLHILHVPLDEGAYPPFPTTNTLRNPLVPLPMSAQQAIKVGHMLCWGTPGFVDPQGLGPATLRQCFLVLHWKCCLTYGPSTWHEVHD